MHRALDIQHLACTFRVHHVQELLSGLVSSTGLLAELKLLQLTLTLLLLPELQGLMLLPLLQLLRCPQEDAIDHRLRLESLLFPVLLLPDTQGFKTIGVVGCVGHRGSPESRRAEANGPNRRPALDRARLLDGKELLELSNDSRKLLVRVRGRWRFHSSSNSCRCVWRRGFLLYSNPEVPRKVGQDRIK